VCTTPLGTPVDPEVKNSTAGASRGGPGASSGRPCSSDSRGVRPAQRALDLRWGVAGVQRGGHRARVEAGEIGQHRLRPVGQHERHPLARQPVRGHRRRQRARPRGQLGVAPPVPVVHEGGPIAPRPGMRGDQVGRAGRRALRCTAVRLFEHDLSLSPTDDHRFRRGETECVTCGVWSKRKGWAVLTQG
jgi:hypothetical protein